MATNPGVTREQRERDREYCPAITYRWEVDGQGYMGSCHRLRTTHEKYRQRGKTWATATTYRKEALIAVHYDPDDPSEAVLDRSASGAAFVPLPLGVVLAALGWLGLRKSASVRRTWASGAAEPLGLV
jgi:hypothetical protein